MPLSTVVAGPYTAVWSATDIGDVEDGFRLRFTVSKELITGDPYGDSVIDSVYRGANWFLSFVCMEYADAIAVFWPYGAQGVVGQVGRLDVGSSIISPVVLTAVAGTTAALVPATLTGSESIISESAQPDIAFASRRRFVPIELRLYPNVPVATTVWYTVT